MTEPGELARRVIAGERAALARAITWVESTRDRQRADALLDALLAHAGGSARIGITGVPGVGKSTFIDALGMFLVERGHRVAVLAVDPSSALSGGSILGDKSRMDRLSRDARAFIRPSPSAGTLGGVARRTRESMLLCEAAGYDVVLVETVGVGQSEYAVSDMVDTFVLLALPGAGDELQGIKRGVVELADVVAVNKADGDNLGRARIAATELEAALRYLRPRVPGWTPPVVQVSAVERTGIDALWQAVEGHLVAVEKGPTRASLRAEQAVRWMWSEIDEGLRDALRRSAASAAIPGLEAEVRSGQSTPSRAAQTLLERFSGSGRP